MSKRFTLEGLDRRAFEAGITKAIEKEVTRHSKVMAEILHELWWGPQPDEKPPVYVVEEEGEQEPFVIQHDIPQFVEADDE